MYKELLTNEDLRLKVMMVLRVVNVVVVLVLAVMCLLQDHVVEKQPLTGKAAVSYVEKTAISSVGVNGPWWSQLLTMMAKETTYTRMLQAAHDKNDVAMIRRLNGVPNDDLVATEAR